ncbi:hypothetical protein BH11PLA1_BH11PLA1_19720 [soil metagenome]
MSEGGAPSRGEHDRARRDGAEGVDNGRGTGQASGMGAEDFEVTEHVARATPAPALIARELSGTLPCVNCGYDLQGVSVLGVCPECGTAVRATILAVVDPMADELQPVGWPRSVAAGLVAWTGFLLLGTVLAWRVALTPLIGVWSDARLEAVPPAWAWIVAACFFAAGAGSIALWKPQDGTRPWMAALAMTSTLCTIPLGFEAHSAILHSRGVTLRAVSELWRADWSTTFTRLGLAGLLLAILGLARPAARVLVARSLAIRLGRVDRQTLLAMMAALVIAAAGDILGALGTAPHGPGGGSSSGETLQNVGAVLLLGGGALFTLGLVGALVDSVRVARAIIAPSPGVRHVFGADARAHHLDPLHRDQDFAP